MIKIRETQINLTAEAGRTAEGCIHIDAASSGRVTGEVISDYVRIVPARDRFAGRHVTVSFHADTEGLREGESFEGSLLLLSGGGETRIPVHVDVRASGDEMPMRYFDTPEDFAKRAEAGPDDAFRFFRSSMFPVFLRQHDDESERLSTVYRGLTAHGCTKQAMEEFLVSAGLKEPVTVTPDVTDVSFYSVGDSVMETVTLRRSGWGTFAIAAEAVGDFIELVRTDVSDEDFVGKSMNFPFLLRKDRLGHGRRYGKIIFQMPHGGFELRITASAEPRREQHAGLTADQNLLRIGRELEAWCLKKTEDRDLADVLSGLLSRAAELDPERESSCLLLQAAACFISGRNAEAQTLLGKRAKSAGIDSETEPLRLAAEYLEAACSRSEFRRDLFEDRVRSIQEKYPDNIVLFELLIRTVSEYRRYPRRRLKTARSFFEAGLRSPLLYAEVLRDLCADASLLTKLDPFMQQVLLTGVRNGVLTEELSLRAAFLADNEKRFSQMLFRILAGAYRKFQLDGILESVIRLLMKGQPGDSRCFPWFERAVERDLRVIRLYECYVESLPENRKSVLPLKIRKYFIYNHTLSAEGSVRLYANIARNREEDPDTFEAYRERITSFAEASLRAGRISDEYAVLYQAVIRKLGDAASCGTMVKVMFSEQLFTDDSRIRAAAVVHPAFREESVYPVSGGSACIRRVSDRSRVLLEDSEGRRFVSSVDYLTEPLLDERLFRNMCREQCPDDPEMIVSRTEEFVAKQIEDAESFRIWRRAAGNPVFSDEFRREARKHVLHYISLHPENSVFSAGTDRAVLREYADADIQTLIRVLMAGGLDESAYAMLPYAGDSGVEPECLALLTSRMIGSGNGGYDERLVKYAREIFRNGNHDEQILRYLVQYGNGSMEELLQIRREAEESLMDTSALDERILERCVFTGMTVPEMADIFRKYVKGGAKESLVMDFLEFYCDLVLHRGFVPDAFIAEYIAFLTENGKQTDFCMKLCYLRYTAEKADLSPREKALTAEFLAESKRRGLRFAFYRKFPGELTAAFRLKDRVFIEQAAEAGDTVTITYCLYEENGENTPHKWKTEVLPMRYRGIFSEEFTLFYGEVLRYVISVEHDGVTTVSEEKTAVSDGTDPAGSSRYQRINAMLVSWRRGDTESLREQLTGYFRASEASGRLFSLEE